jgi:acetoacetate decarboxylase
VTIDEFRGFGSPLTARGQASPYGPNPWHMSGRNLTVWFRAPVGEVERHVPAPLTVPPGGLCRVRFYELIHNAGLDDDRLHDEDPARGRFHEAVLAVPVAHGENVGDYSVHLYSEDIDYISWARETVGWPVKGGTITISQPWPGRPLEQGSTITATLERHGRRLITVRLTLTEPLPRDQYPARPMPTYTIKVIPGAGHGAPALRQLVEVRPNLPSMSDIWRAEATLELGAGPSDELHFFAPFEVVRAEYCPSIDLTMPLGRVLAEL